MLETIFARHGCQGGPKSGTKDAFLIRKFEAGILPLFVIDPRNAAR
jgi:hypothetical protein